MKVDVELISSEIIKPHSPTPDHLRHYKLSYLDQLCPKTYNPLVFFYVSNDYHYNDQDNKFNISEISNKIKTSLSKILTLFYPLAGRVKDDRFIDCNDEGVSYSVARVNSTCQLSKAIENDPPSTEVLCKFLSFEVHQLTEFALGVQLNVFKCGGIVVGLCISHQVADALSCIMFVKSWAAMARGEPIAHPDLLSAATFFPPKDDPGFDAASVVAKNCLTKRFVFHASTIETIRLSYKHKESSALRLEEKPPSRIEALSAFILNRFAEATSEKDSSVETEKVYTVVYPVNIRPRLEPPLPEHSFGNLSLCGYAILGEDHIGYGAVRKIREGIRKVDKEYLSRVQRGEDPHLKLLEEYAQELTMKGGQHISLCFSSLCRFPLYEADFGWGEPTWVSSAALCFSNFIAFMDTKAGNGIEAYIALKEEHMAKLETDHAFLKAVSPFAS